MGTAPGQARFRDIRRKSGVARRDRPVETSTTIFLLHNRLLICCSLSVSTAPARPAMVVVMMLTSSVRCPPARVSDQKISSLMTRTNERTIAGRDGKGDKPMSTRFLLWFGWIKWARERASEARPDLCLICLPSSPLRSCSWMDGYVALPMDCGTTHLPRQSCQSTDQCTAEF